MDKSNYIVVDHNQYGWWCSIDLFSDQEKYLWKDGSFDRHVRPETMRRLNQSLWPGYFNSRRFAISVLKKTQKWKELKNPKIVAYSEYLEKQIN